MSDTATPDLNPEVKEFVDLWVASFAQVLETIRGKPSTVEARLEAPPELTPEPATDVHIVLLPAGILRGEMNIRLPRTCAVRLGQTLMAEAIDESKELSAELREACDELLRQVAGRAATALKAKWGEVQLTAQSSQAPSWTPAASAYLRESVENSMSWLCEFQLSAAAVAALRMVRAPAGDASAEPAPELAGNLGLLMDVELKLALRFGSRRMLLKDILDLGAGAVIELDRRVQEPVELLLDGKLVARGEVVVVDGNYGLRVTEMALAKAA
jgi:flagellar motor switch protein FliN